MDSAQYEPPSTDSHVAGSSDTRLWQLLSPHDKILLLSGSRCTSVKPNTVIVSQGCPSTHVYLNQSGRLRLSCYSRQGSRRDLRWIGPFELVECSTPFELASLTESQFYQIPQTCIDNAFDKSPTLAQVMTRVLRACNADALSQLSSAWIGNTLARTAFALARLTIQFGQSTKDGLVELREVSHLDIASFAGQSRVRTSIALERLELVQVIAIHRRKIVVRDIDMLSDYATGIRS